MSAHIPVCSPQYGGVCPGAPPSILSNPIPYSPIPDIGPRFQAALCSSFEARCAVVVLCGAALRYAISAMRWHRVVTSDARSAMLCDALQCSAMLCYAMSCSAVVSVFPIPDFSAILCGLTVGRWRPVLAAVICSGRNRTLPRLCRRG